MLLKEAANQKKYYYKKTIIQNIPKINFHKYKVLNGFKRESKKSLN